MWCFVDFSKKRVGVIDSDSDDDSKENSKVLANKAKESSKESPAQKVSEPEQPALDKDGLPPLRKTGWWCLLLVFYHVLIFCHFSQKPCF